MVSIFLLELSEKNNNLFWIPAGFAHGFVALEDDTIFSYKCTEVYNKKSEESLLWNDTQLNINWGETNPLVSNKDMNAKRFKDFKTQF